MNFNFINKIQQIYIILLIFLFACSQNDTSINFTISDLPEDINQSIIYKTPNDDINIFKNDEHYEILKSDEYTKLYWPTISSDNSLLAYSYIKEQQTDYKIGINILNLQNLESNEIYSSLDPTKNLLSNNIPHYMGWSPTNNILNFTTPTNNYPSLYVYKYDIDTSEKIIDFGPLWVNWGENDLLSVHRRDKRFVFEINQQHTKLIDTESVSMFYRIDPWFYQNNKIDQIVSIYQNYDVVSIFKSDIHKNNNILITDVNEYSMINISPDKNFLSILSSETYPSSIYNNFKLVNLNSNETILNYENYPIGYFWSPDSSKILLITKPRNTNVYDINIVYTNDLSVRKLQSIKLSDEQLEMIVFSDQFSASHNLWSSDSSELIIAGSIEFDKTVDETGINGPDNNFNIIKISNLNSNPTTTILFPGLLGYWTN